jgi:aryl-alcohol dehydrogenase-like predicted oxidoreductase
MEKTRRIAGTDVARIGLGTNRLTNTSEGVAFVRAAVEAGIGLVDTAHLYTGGESEATVGAALSPVPEGCVVATKGGYRPGEGKPEVLRAQIEESLRKLRTDSIGLYYLHRVDPETPLEESLGVIREYHDRGAIREIGISHVGVDEIERARRVVPIAAVQNPYNLADRTYDEVLDYCAGQGITFVAYYPLHAELGPAVHEIAERHGATPRQVALAWLLQRSPAILPIPGTLSLEHLRENLGALQLQLSDDEVAALR